MRIRKSVMELARQLRGNVERVFELDITKEELDEAIDYLEKRYIDSYDASRYLEASHLDELLAVLQKAEELL